MSAFIIWLQLARTEPVIAVSADNCAAAHSWYAKATAWAERSGIQPGQGPICLCHRIRIEDPSSWRSMGYTWPDISGQASKPVAGLTERRGL
jgi:hypothetical protein